MERWKANGRAHHTTARDSQKNRRRLQALLKLRALRAERHALLRMFPELRRRPATI